MNEDDLHDEFCCSRDELKCAVYIQGKCLAKMSFNAEQVKIKNVNIRNLEKLVRFVLSLPGSHADREREMMFSLMNSKWTDV